MVAAGFAAGLAEGINELANKVERQKERAQQEALQLKFHQEQLSLQLDSINQNKLQAAMQGQGKWETLGYIPGTNQLGLIPMTPDQIQTTKKQLFEQQLQFQKAQMDLQDKARRQQMEEFLKNQPLTSGNTGFAGSDMAMSDYFRIRYGLNDPEAARSYLLKQQENQLKIQGEQRANETKIADEKRVSANEILAYTKKKLVDEQLELENADRKAARTGRMAKAQAVGAAQGQREVEAAYGPSMSARLDFIGKSLAALQNMAPGADPKEFAKAVGEITKELSAISSAIGKSENIFAEDEEESDK